MAEDTSDFKTMSEPTGHLVATGDPDHFPSIHFHPKHTKGTPLEDAEHGDEQTMEIKVRHHRIEGKKGEAHHHVHVLGFRKVKKVRKGGEDKETPSHKSSRPIFA